MSNKTKTPQNDPEKASVKAMEKKASTTPSPSPKKYVNIFMVVVLLIIAGGFYLYQKGYITQHYPLAQSTISPFNNSENPDKIPDETPQKAIDHAEDFASPSDSTADNPPEPRALVSSPEEHPEITFLQDRLQALETKVEMLSQTPPALPSEAPFSQGQNASLQTFSTLQELTYKIQQGLPFDTELQALETLFSQEDFDTLKTFSKVGVPTLPLLIQNFKAVARLLDQEDAFQNATTFLEKARALLNQLIHIEKIEGPAQPTDSKTATYKKRLRQGDVGGVITEINALNPANETVMLWITHGKAYHITQTILTKTKKAFLGS